MGLNRGLLIDNSQRQRQTNIESERMRERVCLKHDIKLEEIKP